MSISSAQLCATLSVCNKDILLIDGDNVSDFLLNLEYCFKVLNTGEFPLHVFFFMSRDNVFKRANKLISESWFFQVRAITDSKDASDVNIVIAATLSISLCRKSNIYICSRDTIFSEAIARLKEININDRRVDLILPINFHHLIKGYFPKYDVMSDKEMISMIPVTQSHVSEPKEPYQRCEYCGKDNHTGDRCVRVSKYRDFLIYIREKYGVNTTVLSSDLGKHFADTEICKHAKDLKILKKRAVTEGYLKVVDKTKTLLSYMIHESITDIN